MKKYDAGFVTVTFDMCHAGHFELLRSCKNRCKYLTVGLTTDERARVEKRVTVLTYAQREAILQNCKWVDEVIPNHGTPKTDMYKRLKFDVLFSGDEYVDSTEFTSFTDMYPDIPVLFFPRQLQRSSTRLINELFERFYDSQKIIASSIYGNIIRQGFGKPFIVTKSICYSPHEANNEWETKDTLGFYRWFDLLPRNWNGQDDGFPLISGVHPNRECLVNRMLKDQPWCTYVSDHCIFKREDNLDRKELPSQMKNLQEFANYVVSERQKAHKIVQIVQRDAGITLEEWCRKHPTAYKELQTMIEYIETTILRYLKAQGIVHCDPHPRNLLVQEDNLQVSLIDFGWVTSLKFDLCAKERAAVQDMLDNDFDLKQFRNSLAYTPSVAAILKQEPSSIEMKTNNEILKETLDTHWNECLANLQTAYKQRLQALVENSVVVHNQHEELD